MICVLASILVSGIPETATFMTAFQLATAARLLFPGLVIYPAVKPLPPKVSTGIFLLDALRRACIPGSFLRQHTDEGIGDTVSSFAKIFQQR